MEVTSALQSCELDDLTAISDCQEGGIEVIEVQIHPTYRVLLHILHLKRHVPRCPIMSGFRFFSGELFDIGCKAKVRQDQPLVFVQEYVGRLDVLVH